MKPMHTTPDEMAALRRELEGPELATVDGVEIREQTAGEQLAGLRGDDPENFVSPYLRGPHNRTVEQVLAERREREAEIEDHLDQIERDQTRDMIRCSALFDALIALALIGGFVIAGMMESAEQAPGGKVYTERLAP